MRECTDGMFEDEDDKTDQREDIDKLLDLIHEHEIPIEFLHKRTDGRWNSFCYVNPKGKESISVKQLKENLYMVMKEFFEDKETEIYADDDAIYQPLAKRINSLSVGFEIKKKKKKNRDDDRIKYRVVSDEEEKDGESSKKHKKRKHKNKEEKDAEPSKKHKKRKHENKEDGKHKKNKKHKKTKHEQTSEEEKDRDKSSQEDSSEDNNENHQPSKEQEEEEEEQENNVDVSIPADEN